MYNPFSLLSALQAGVMQDYWFATGTPSFLLTMLQHSSYPLETLTEGDIDISALNDLENWDDLRPISFQSGYLTIASHDMATATRTLRYPNREVEQGFFKYLTRYYFSPRFSVSRAVELRRLLEAGDVERFLEQLQAFFNRGGYSVVGNAEVYFPNTLYAVFRMMGVEAEAERRTARGRIGMLVTVPRFRYLFELKLDQSAEPALAQIDAKGYEAGVDPQGKTVIRVGINFSIETRSIEGWAVQR